MKKKQAIKDVLYGGMLELSHNREYFYRSSVGARYSHWTEEGRKELLNLLEQTTQDMLEVEEELIKDRAKDMFVEKLKG